MTITLRNAVAGLSTSLVVGLGAFTGTASATSLDVTIPCGCKPLHAFAGEPPTNYTQPVGDAVGSTPAVDNPSGTAGNANNSNGLGLTGDGLIYPSGSASFS